MYHTEEAHRGPCSKVGWRALEPPESGIRPRALYSALMQMTPPLPLSDFEGCDWRATSSERKPTARNRSIEGSAVLTAWISLMRTGEASPLPASRLKGSVLPHSLHLYTVQLSNCTVYMLLYTLFYSFCKSSLVVSVVGNLWAQSQLYMNNSPQRKTYLYEHFFASLEFMFYFLSTSN